MTDLYKLQHCTRQSSKLQSEKKLHSDHTRTPVSRRYLIQHRDRVLTYTLPNNYVFSTDMKARLHSNVKGFNECVNHDATVFPAPHKHGTVYHQLQQRQLQKTLGLRTSEKILPPCPQSLPSFHQCPKQLADV